MRILVSLIFIFLSTLSFSQTFKYERANIDISFDTTFYIPESWKITKSKVVQNHAYYVNIIKSSLDKYPVGILKNIKKVYLLNTLLSNGVSMGGTKYDGSIFIKIKGITDVNIEKTLHHEFCHMLYFKYENLFPITDWMKNTKMKYVGGGFKASYNGSDGKEHKPELFVDGFLYDYATISIDEDMASFAETMFFDVDKIDIKNNQLLKNKYLLLVSFYKKIDVNIHIVL